MLLYTFLIWDCTYKNINARSTTNFLNALLRRWETQFRVTLQFFTEKLEDSSVRFIGRILYECVQTFKRLKFDIIFRKIAKQYKINAYQYFILGIEHQQTNPCWRLLECLVSGANRWPSWLEVCNLRVSWGMKWGHCCKLWSIRNRPNTRRQ